jgi:hypothetical protein
VSCVTRTNKQTSQKAAWLALDCALPRRAKQIHFDTNLSFSRSAFGVWCSGSAGSWASRPSTAFQHVARAQPLVAFNCVVVVVD